MAGFPCGKLTNLMLRLCTRKLKSRERQLIFESNQPVIPKSNQAHRNHDALAGRRKIQTRGDSIDRFDTVPAIKCLNQENSKGRQPNVYQRRWNQPLPADVHQLIVTKPWQCPTQPEIQIKHGQQFHNEDEQTDYNIEIMVTIRLG